MSVADDPEKVTAAQKKVRKKKQEFADDLRSVLAAGAGRRVLHEVLNRTGVFAVNTFTGDALSTSHNVGKQDIGRWLFREIAAADAAAIGLMMEKDTGNDE